MHRIATFALALACALAVGCGWPRTSAERAEWFFGYGEEWILDALDDADASDGQVDAAGEILASHEVEVTDALEDFFTRHRELMRSLAGGAETDVLLEHERALSSAHREALTRIGEMHEALGDTVGRRTWAAARSTMQERIDERLEE